MGETRLNLEYLLEDLPDTYPSLMNQTGELLLPKPLHSSFKFREAGFQFRL